MQGDFEMKPKTETDVNRRETKRERFLQQSRQSRKKVRPSEAEWRGRGLLKLIGNITKLMNIPTEANSGLLRNFWLKWKCENGQYWIDSFITRNYSLLECAGTVDWMDRPIINSSNLISPIHKLLHKAGNSPKINWLPETRALRYKWVFESLANFESISEFSFTWTMKGSWSRNNLLRSQRVAWSTQTITSA